MGVSICLSWMAGGLKPIAPRLAGRWAMGWLHGDASAWDAMEAEQLYRLLEEEIVPCFYRRDENGLPQEWIARMRESMAQLSGRFSSNRMVR